MDFFLRRAWNKGQNVHPVKLDSCLQPSPLHLPCYSPFSMYHISVCLTLSRSFSSLSSYLFCASIAVLSVNYFFWSFDFFLVIEEKLLLRMTMSKKLMIVTSNSNVTQYTATTPDYIHFCFILRILLARTRVFKVVKDDHIVLIMYVQLPENKTFKWKLLLYK